MKQRTNIEKLHQNSRNVKAKLQQSPFEEKKMECNNTAECNLSGSGGQTLSVVVLLIYELGHSRQLHIRRALVNGTCTRRQNKALERIPALQNKVNFVEFPPPRHESRETRGLIIQSTGEPKCWWWKEKWHSALAASLAVCWYNGTLMGGGNSCRVRLQPLLSFPPPHPPALSAQLWSNRETATPDLPSALVSCVLSTATISQTVRKTPVVQVMLTNFTVSVVLLYGVVLGEADSSHPFDAFGRG